MYLDLNIFWYLYSKTYTKKYFFLQCGRWIDNVIAKQAMRLQVQNIETKMKVMHRRVILKWLLTWRCSALAVSKSRPVSRMYPVQESNLACGWYEEEQ